MFAPIDDWSTLAVMLRYIDKARSYRVFERPIILLSAPRSGSTFLFDLLSKFPEIRAWHAEMDAVWWQYFPCERLDEPSDYIGGGEYSDAVGRALRREFYKHAIWAYEETGHNCSLGERLGVSAIRYLDKTIANCFHVEIIEKLFPDALYISLIRDGRATISSMMEGWLEGTRFVKPHLKAFITKASSVDNWAFPAPPEWRSVLNKPLEEICAWSWMQHVDTVDTWLRGIPDDRKTFIRYEQLLDDPGMVAEKLARFCGLTRDAAVANHLTERPLSRTTLSTPDRDKWQRLHGEQIRRVLPQIAPTLDQHGYFAG